ncbi:MAG TPA: aminoglycoside phosphotransferase family protein [Streptosporangiaceae bacterium]|nr:aminoglycoside phosphotransferase family protein [Streptosporangiaceae bacterium]
MDFRRRRPSSQTLDWVERVAGARVAAWRRMTGGISGSVVHRLRIDHGSYRDVLVLRQYEHADGDTAALVRREVATLRAVHDAGLPAPEPIAADAGGGEADGHPAMLMTRLPGRLDVTPADPEGWLRQIAAMAVRIHNAQVAGEPFEARIDAAAFTTNGWRQRTRSLVPVSAGAPVIPASATRPAVWEAAFGILRQQAPEPATCFIHRDFQLFNLLWRRGRLSGVVDWTRSCTGPADFDLGHCRLNVAVLFGADWAERFRRAYEAEAGRAMDPWWDLYAVTAYSDEWRGFIPLMVAGRAPVDVDGMTSRVEDLLEATLGRL